MADPAEGTPTGTPSTPPLDPKEKGNTPQKAPIEQPHNPAPPITAEAVLKGTKTERELELEQKLKEREMEAAGLRDENQRLKTPPAQPRAQHEAKKKHWLEGGTFFDIE